MSTHKFIVVVPSTARDLSDSYVVVCETSVTKVAFLCRMVRRRESTAFCDFGVRGSVVGRGGDDLEEKCWNGYHSREGWDNTHLFSSSLATKLCVMNVSK